MEYLDSRQRDLVQELKDTAGIDDDVEAIYRLQDYNWDLQAAMRNNFGTESETDPASEDNESGEQPRHSEADGSPEILVKGDERLSFLPKYVWDCEDTRNWKKDARKTLHALCQQVTYDYQKFNTERQMAFLEEMIAVTLFGIDQNIAIKALRTNNLLCAYSDEQRFQVIKVRLAIEECHRDPNVLIQAVPFLVRTDKHIKEKKFESYFLSVFRVQKENCADLIKYIDFHGKIHKTWEGFLDNCQGLPYGMMAYPRNGFLRDRINKDGDISFDVCDVEFCETPSSSFMSRNKEIIQGCLLVITTASLSLYVLSRRILFEASMASVMQLGQLMIESYRIGSASNLSLNAISQIITNWSKQAAHHFLRKVAQQHRELTILEKMIINAADSADNLIPIVCCACATAVAATNVNSESQMKELVMEFYSVCRQLFSCVLAPKTAERLLKEVRAELGLEEMRNIRLLNEKKEQLEREYQQLKDGGEGQAQTKKETLERCILEIMEAEQRFQTSKSIPLQNALPKYTRLEKLKKEWVELDEQSKQTPLAVEDIDTDRRRRLEEEMDKIKEDIVRLQTEHLQQVMLNMTDSSAKDEFKEQVIKRCAQRNNIDETYGVIQVICEIDAAVLFKKDNDSHYSITFPTGGRMNVPSNNQLPGAGETERETEIIARCTGIEINEALKHHEKAKIEYEEFLAWLKGFIPEEDSSFINDLKPKSCKQLLNSLSKLSEEDKPIALRAALLFARELKFSIGVVLDECLRIVVSYAIEKCNELADNNSAPSNSDETKAIAEQTGLSETEIRSEENRPLVFTCLLKQLAVPGNMTKKHVNIHRKTVERLKSMLKNSLNPSEAAWFSQ